MGIWACLERFLSPATVIVEWQEVLGPDFGNAKSFLYATDKQAEEYPCTNRPPCDCAHEVVAHAHNRIVAACRCDPPGCKTIKLQPRDIVIHALDAVKLCRAIRRAFRFDDPPDERAVLYSASHVWTVGNYGALHSPVYLLARPSEPEFVREIEGLITCQPEPFILLAPTQRHRTPTVQAILQRQQSVFIPLSRTLALNGPGRFMVTHPVQPILDRFTAGLAAGAGLVKTVEKFGRDLDAVAKGNYELRKENEDLRRLAADGYFKFVLSVDPLDFRYFAAIFAKGDRAKAAQLFKDEIGERRFYERIDSWKSRGPEYKRMYRIVEARKNAGRHGKIRLNESLQSASVQDEAENPDTMQDVLDKLHADNLDQRSFPSLLQDILNALLDMNDTNWRAIRDELVPAIREEVPQ